MNRLKISWYEFDQLIKWLALSRTPIGTPGVYGEPRGGLIPAICLSHALRLPLLSFAEPGCIWVDDIVDSGRTLLTAPVDSHRMALVARQPWDGVAIARIVPEDAWIIFPWESEADWEEEADTYALSRQ